MANKPRISGSYCGLLDWLLDKLIAEGFGCGGEAGEALALEPGFVGALTYIDVVLSVVQHAVNQGRQLPRDGEDGHHAQDGRDTDGAGAVGLLPGQRPCPLLCERFFPESRVKRLRPLRTLAAKSHYSRKPKQHTTES